MKLENFQEVGSGFYNLKTSFYTNTVINVGSQMSLLLLKSTGKYLVLDTCALTAAAKIELDYLTQNGALIDGVIATHPFHTTYFTTFHAMYPDAKYYGTPRHLKMIPSIPWAGDVDTTAVRTLWEPEVEMRIPNGAEFVNPTNHFSSLFVFHRLSKTIHDDDTLIYFDPGHVGCCLKLAGATACKLYFHPSLANGGLYSYKESPGFFKEWVQQLINDWDFENICTAHHGTLIGNGKRMLQQTLKRYESKFRRMSRVQSVQVGHSMHSTSTKSRAGHSNSPMPGIGQSMKLRPLRELPVTVNSVKKLNAVYIEAATDIVIGDLASVRDVLPDNSDIG